MEASAMNKIRSNIDIAQGKKPFLYKLLHQKTIK